MITNEPDYEERGYTGVVMFTEHEGHMTLSASHGSTSSCAYPTVRTYGITFEYFGVRIVEAYVYDTGRTDGEYANFKELTARFMKAKDNYKTQMKIRNEIIQFTMRFAFNYSKIELSNFFLTNMNLLYQAGHNAGRRGLQEEIRHILDVKD